MRRAQRRGTRSKGSIRTYPFPIGAGPTGRRSSCCSGNRRTPRRPAWQRDAGPCRAVGKAVELEHRPARSAGRIPAVPRRAVQWKSRRRRCRPLGMSQEGAGGRHSSRLAARIEHEDAAAELVFTRRFCNGRYNGRMPPIIDIQGLVRRPMPGFVAPGHVDPGDPLRRDVRGCSAQRRRQDHAHQHRLRHRQRQPRHGDGGRLMTSGATGAQRAAPSAWCRRELHRQLSR